jgi:hypothetical protein
MKWQKGKVLDSIVHHGPVGINTDRPFSALTVNGNVAVTGTIMHPSDLRIKEQLEPMDNKKQLENIQAMRLYEYQVRRSSTCFVYLCLRACACRERALVCWNLGIRVCGEGKLWRLFS